MNRYKISQTTDVQEETGREQNRHEHSAEILEIMKQFPKGYSIIYGDDGISIADPERHIIVNNEPTLLLALKHALHRFRFMDLIAKATAIKLLA